MKCDVVSTRKGWSSWCKTHSREQIACLKEEVELLRSALAHALSNCPDVRKTIEKLRTDPHHREWFEKGCSVCYSMVLAIRGDH